MSRVFGPLLEVSHGLFHCCIKRQAAFQFNTTTAGLLCSQRECSSIFKWYANNHTSPKRITTSMSRGETAIRLWDITDIVLWNFVYLRLISQDATIRPRPVALSKRLDRYLRYRRMHVARVKRNRYSFGFPANDPRFFLSCPYSG